MIYKICIIYTYYFLSSQKNFFKFNDKGNEWNLKIFIIMIFTLELHFSDTIVGCYFFLFSRI